jgi:hypothetical protein
MYPSKYTVVPTLARIFPSRQLSSWFPFPVNSHEGAQKWPFVIQWRTVDFLYLTVFTPGAHCLSLC